MKINFQKTALALALIFAGAQAAHADLGIEQSRTFNSGGGQTTMKMGVAPSDFDPTEIAYKITTAGTGELGQLWGVTPEQPSLASERAAQQAVINGANMAARSVPQFGIGGVGGNFLPSITDWVAWGIQAGFISPGYYSQVLANCLVRESGNTSEEGRMFRTQACQVQAYIQSYAVNPKGYVGGNLMGLVPLCEVQQQNDCNITGGSFNPMARLQQVRAERAAEERNLPLQMHAEKYALYLALKDCKSQRDTGKLDAAAYRKCVNESIPQN